MKNIFKTFISCIVLTVGVTSCYDEMDSKSSIDAQYDQASNITASLGESTVLSFSEISINGTWSANGKNQEFGMKVEKGTPIDSKDRIAEKILEGMRKANSYKGSDSRNLYLYYQTDKEDLCLAFAPN